jgi:ribosomal protein L11 methyltransferase
MIMGYKAVCFSLNPPVNEFSEILCALLDFYGFEGIMEENSSIVGYLNSLNFIERSIDDIKLTMANLGCQADCTIKEIEDQNWNSVWESNFEPVTIGDICVVRAPFHSEYPNFKYRITIEPKMSFGTGHHFTTRLMIEQILACEMKGLQVLDMGCGTGILSILASMCGARFITAIDIDNWAFENAVENTAKNNVQNVRVLMGGKETIPNMKFDVILSNINRNILLDQIPYYARVTNAGSLILMSGFLNEDIPVITEAAMNSGFETLNNRSINEWALVMFKKI